MPSVRVKNLVPFPCALMSVATAIPAGRAQEPGSAFHPVVPRTWDDVAMATLEVALADPVGSPKHVSADYYYHISVRAIYKQYPVYAPGHEPPGYLDGLKSQGPVIVWDDNGHRAALNTEAD